MNSLARWYFAGPPPNNNRILSSMPKTAAQSVARVQRVQLGKIVIKESSNVTVHETPLATASLQRRETRGLTRATANRDEASRGPRL
jgi:hypothetical protein